MSAMSDSRGLAFRYFLVKTGDVGEDCETQTWAIEVPVRDWKSIRFEVVIVRDGPSVFVGDIIVDGRFPGRRVDWDTHSHMLNAARSLDPHQVVFKDPGDGDIRLTIIENFLRHGIALALAMVQIGVRS